jgi:hypothetical protein
MFRFQSDAAAYRGENKEPSASCGGFFVVSERLLNFFLNLLPFVFEWMNFDQSLETQ